MRKIENVQQIKMLEKEMLLSPPAIHYSNFVESNRRETEYEFCVNKLSNDVIGKKQTLHKIL